MVSERPRDPEHEVVARVVLEEEIARGGQEVRCVGKLPYTQRFMLYLGNA